MSGGSKAVFLSYASEDSEAAQRIADALAAAGIEVWFDQAELRGGDAWDHKIRQQIQRCALFVPLVSRATEARLEGYFRREWRLAADRMLDMADSKPFLLPVVIDETRERGAQTPESFAKVQWTRMPRGEAPPAFIARVAAMLEAGASVAPGTASTPTAVASDAPRTPRRRRALWAVTAAILACVAAGGGWLVRAKVIDGQHSAAARVVDKSIAVLPFVDMSERHDQEYFSDGLTEELIDKLARAQDLKVIARTSSFAFKNKSQDIRSIAAALGVAHLLEGSVRKAGTVLRITVQLVRATDGTHVWSDTYERADADIFRVQDEIAGAVTQVLHATVATPFRSSSIGDVEAAVHDLLLKGEYFQFRGHPGDAERSAQYFEQATALQPGSAATWAHLAATYLLLTEGGDAHPLENRRKAIDAIEHVRSLDPDYGFGHRVTGSMHVVFDQDLHAALHEFLLARRLGLEPGPQRRNEVDIELMRYLITRNADKVIAALKVSIDLDPLNVEEKLRLAQILVKCKMPQQAEDQYRRAIALDAAYASVHAGLAWALHLQGRDAEAWSEVAKESDPEARAVTTIILKAATGKRDEARKLLDGYVPSREHYDAYGIAEIYLLLGDKDAALSWLERVRAEGQFGLHDLNTDPDWAPIRAEPRFQALLHAMKFDQPVSE